ncbi:MAG: hypothetical protein AB7V02_06070 [Parvularculaceae bacterium]
MRAPPDNASPGALAGASGSEVQIEEDTSSISNEPAPEASREFSWIDDTADIVVAGQAQIAVHENPCGEIVIRQQGELYDDDAVIRVRPDNALGLAAAINRLADRLKIVERGRA